MPYYYYKLFSNINRAVKISVLSYPWYTVWYTTAVSQSAFRAQTTQFIIPNNTLFSWYIITFFHLFIVNTSIQTLVCFQHNRHTAQSQRRLVGRKANSNHSERKYADIWHKLQGILYHGYSRLRDHTELLVSIIWFLTSWHRPKYTVGDIEVCRVY